MNSKSNQETQQRLIEIRADIQSGDSRNWKSLVQADLPWLLNEYVIQKEEIMKLRAELEDYHDSGRVMEKAMKEMEEAENEVECQMQERINEERNNYLYDRDDE